MPRSVVCMTILLTISFGLRVSGCCSGARCVAWAANRLGFEAPVEVAEVAICKDGGSQYILFRDASGTTHPVCQDLGMGNRYGTYGEILAAASPSQRGRVLGSQEREAIAILLKDWLRRNVAADKLAMLTPSFTARFKDDPVLEKGIVIKRFVEILEEVDRFQSADTQ